MLRYQFINYKIEISKEIVKMGTSFEDILKRMRNAPHVGVAPVTNPKVPTKVERDVAAFAARRKEMPKFEFGKGTFLEKLTERMANAPHPTPTYADQKFNVPEPFIDETAFEEWDSNFQAFVEKRKAEKQKRKAKLKPLDK